MELTVVKFCKRAGHDISSPDSTCKDGQCKACKSAYNATHKAATPEKRRCEGCSIEFTTSNPRKRYHSPQCRAKDYQESRPSQHPNICAGTVGAIGELKVGVDLLSRGFAVFRALSPACFCDLIITKGGQTHSVEVRTGYRLKSGALTYATHSTDKADFFAVVLKDSIEYVPSLE